MSATPPKRRIFATAALPYANGDLHAGHLMEYVQADIWVRAHRMQDHEVHFVCADDAHGAPIMIAAEKAGSTPEAYIQNVSRRRQALLDGFHLAFDHWYTTHSAENIELAQSIFRTLRSRGLISRRTVTQFYDPVKGMFLPDRYLVGTCPQCDSPGQYGDSCEACGAVYAPNDLIEPRSVLTGSTPCLKESDHLFFSLSHPDVGSFLRAWVASGALQIEVLNKSREWLEHGLRDWDISRDAPYFGIEIPDEPGKYFYVWLDAPVGYLASLKNYFEKGHAQRHAHLPSRSLDSFEEFMDSEGLEQVHFIGKDIIYFHTLFWPAMLMASGFRPPTRIHVHGHLTLDGQKMSKSRGNGWDPMAYLAARLDPDSLRYYFAAKLGSTVEDVDFSASDFISRVNADMVGKVVNIASRSAGFIVRDFAGKLGPLDPRGAALLDHIEARFPEIVSWYETGDFRRLVREVMELADRVNAYYDQQKPWILARTGEDQASLHACCSAGIGAFRLLMLMLAPITPGLAARAGTFLGCDLSRFAAAANRLLPGHSIRPYKHLLSRLDPQAVDAMLTGPPLANRRM